MKFEKVDSREATRDGDHFKRETYQLGEHYLVFKDRWDLENGETVVNLTVVDDEKPYTPKIYYRDNYFGEGPKFLAQPTLTRALTLTAEETEQAIKGLQDALEAVKVLTKEFL